MRIGILWDLDGTLLDTIDDLADSVNYTMDQFGYPRRSREEVLSFVGNGARYLVTKAAPEGADMDKVLPVFQTYYKATAR